MALTLLLARDDVDDDRNDYDGCTIFTPITLAYVYSIGLTIYDDDDVGVGS